MICKYSMTNNIESDAINRSMDILYRSIDQYRIPKDSKDKIKPTHISMGNNPGTYSIPDDKLDLFYKIYRKTISKKVIPNLLETHIEQGPIVIDIDLKYRLHTSSTVQRIYTDKEIDIIVKTYNQVITEYLNVTYVEDLEAYVMEKDSSKALPQDDIKLDKITYKDGIHIMYPKLCVDNKVQYFFRDLVISILKKDKSLDHLSLDNDLDDVIDKAVIERNSWLLYGSCKDSKPENLYKLTKILTRSNDSDDLKNTIAEIDEEDYRDLPKELSIRKYKNRSELTAYSDGITDEIIEEKHKKLLSNTGNRLYVSNTLLDEVRSLCLMLSDSRVDTYNKWIEVGFCLHNIDLTLLDLWIDLSRKSSKYKEGECEKHWIKFKNDGLHIGSLYRWAKEDNPELYFEYQLNKYKHIIDKSLSQTEITSYEVANVFNYMNEYSYVCSSVKHKEWFEFKNHRWSRMDEGDSIIKKFNLELSNNYARISSILLNKSINPNMDETEKKKLKDQASKALKISIKLHTMAFKKEVLSELLIIYGDKEFNKKLDENIHLIGFNNGIYDLKNNLFRSGRPEDYLSMNTNIDYKEYNESDKGVKEVLNFFEDIQPEKEMREYLLLKLSSLLEGIQRDQKFEIWTGGGGNGKSCILKLLNDSFGDYGTYLPITLLTKPRGNSSQASPEVAHTKGKRCAIFQEPENDDKIHVGHMKNLTGGDKIMARGLFKDPIEFYPQFKTILACNKLPDIPSADGGTWRRIRVVPFEMKFVDNPTGPNEKKKIDNIEEMMIGWRVPFMSILIHYYGLYRKYGLKEPEKVMKYTNEYQKLSDNYMEFIKEYIVEGESSDYINDDELWKIFKEWYKDSNRFNKKLVKTDYNIEMESKLGKKIGKKFYGFKLKNDFDDDTGFTTRATTVASNMSEMTMTENSLRSVRSNRSIRSHNSANSLMSNDGLDIDDTGDTGDIFIKKHK